MRAFNRANVFSGTDLCVFLSFTGMTTERTKPAITAATQTQNTIRQGNICAFKPSRVKICSPASALKYTSLTAARNAIPSATVNALKKMPYQNRTFLIVRSVITPSLPPYYNIVRAAVFLKT